MTHVKQLLGISFEQFFWVITYIFPFVPLLAPLKNIFCPQTRMQQKVLYILSVMSTVQWSAIFSLCFILLCNGLLECPVGISKRFTLSTLCNSRKCLWTLLNLFAIGQRRHLLKLKETFLWEQVWDLVLWLSYVFKRKVFSAFMPPCIKQLPTFKSKNRKLGSFLFRSCLNFSKYSEFFSKMGPQHKLMASEARLWWQMEQPTAGETRRWDKMCIILSKRCGMERSQLINIIQTSLCIILFSQRNEILS